MEERIDLKTLLPGELETLLLSMGEPKYRARQIFAWLHRGVADLSEMSDLPKSLRAKLGERCFITAPQILRRQVSARDGTIKYLFGLADGNSIETVLMQYEHGNSVCVSTQAGCKMGCVFCASFDPKKSRDLRPSEILDEILFAQKDSGRQISNIVLMGTGEPLDNYDNVMTFLRLVSHPMGINIGMRHISLSTCGLVPMIRRLEEEKLQLTLSVSLHAPNNALRSRLMPVNRAYPLEALIPACKHYFETTGRRISFEYAMIGGVNDTPECARQLIALLKGFPCHVNLIPLNHVAGSPLEPSTRDDLRRFQNELLKHGLNATVRRSLGGDIAASCGQLRRQHNEEVDL
ncbi:MAG: 23S rRNA (adenine(2503)-C(2))-methyltransferase RlmN [Clostridia bacterium]|nr:23S rRNA (adenine(2503)-C(2))-methyltransferase RlmN [Clostridia bacterium]